MQLLRSVARNVASIVSRRAGLALVTHDSAIARRAQRIGVMSRGQLSIRQDSRA